MQPSHRLCWDDLLIPLVAASFVMDAQSEKQAIWRQRSRRMGMTDVPGKNWGSWKHSVAASKQHPPSPLISVGKKTLGSQLYPDCVNQLGLLLKISVNSLNVISVWHMYQGYTACVFISCYIYTKSIWLQLNFTMRLLRHFFFCGPYCKSL